MPILGMDVPEDLVRRTREALLSRIEKSELLTRVIADEIMDGLDFQWILRRTPYTGDYHLRVRSGKKGFNPVARFGILPLPGCRFICVFHYVEVEPALRHNGIGGELLKIRHAAAYEVGYRTAFATVREDNTTEQLILDKANWKLIEYQYNPVTGARVALMRRDL